MNLTKIFICLSFCFVFSLFAKEGHVYIGFRGQLGNQLFQTAAAASLALDNNAQAVITDSPFIPISSIRENYDKVLAKTPYFRFERRPVRTKEASLSLPISYKDGMVLDGFFENYRYFHHNQKAIIELFSPSQDIQEYLERKFSHIITHKNTVAVHVRTYYHDVLTVNRENKRKGITLTLDDLYPKFFRAPDLSFYAKAIFSFPSDALFVVFSDCPAWCKNVFSTYNRNFIFMENNKPYIDLYLMSLCKHQIIANSTFAFWGAYLNQNPHKRVIVRTHWWDDPKKTDNIVLPEWERMEGSQIVPPPDFGDLPLY